MNTSKLIFILISVVFFSIVPLFVKNRRRYFLFLAGFLYIFSSGWIFYHFTGLMLSDLPIIGLLFTGIVSNRKMKWTVNPVTLPLMLFFLTGIQE